MGILDGLINPDDQKYALLGALGSGLLGATTGRNPMQSIARGLGAGVSGLYGGIQAAQGQQYKLLENQRLQQLIDSQVQQNQMSKDRLALDRDKFNADEKYKTYLMGKDTEESQRKQAQTAQESTSFQSGLQGLLPRERARVTEEGAVFTKPGVATIAEGYGTPTLPVMTEPTLAEKLGAIGQIYEGGEKGRTIAGQLLQNIYKQNDYVDMNIDGKLVKVPAAVYVAHVDRDAAREQARQFHNENVAVRKDIADRLMMLRERIPARKALELGEKQQVLDRYASLINSYQDAYGGSLVGGPTMTKIYERTGWQKPRVDFWKNFNEMDSIIRNKLFGATLTGYELENWKSQTVDENTDPVIARQRMLDRLKWATNAMQRDLEGYQSAGYNVSGFGGKRSTPAPPAPTSGRGGNATSSGNRFTIREVK